MSAIPWVGSDLVELKEITEISLEVIYLSSLPVIGTVHKNALKKGINKPRLENQEYLNIPSSFLAFFAGLVDGDGYIQITKTTKGFIAMKLVISLHLEDISTLEYINSVLKVGKLNIYRDNRSPTCKLVINRTDLQEIVFPLFLYHNIFFLTETRADQFNLAMHILNYDIRTFDNIPKNIPASFELLKTPLDYTKLLFFRNWIVGFAMSEGSFFVKANNDGCFQLKQRIHINLFEAFKLVFATNRKIALASSFDWGCFAETEKGLYNQLPQYTGLVEFTKANPLTYKRVKKDFKRLCSNKETYNYIKRIYLLKQRKLNAIKREHYCTYAIKPKNTEMVFFGSTVETGHLTNRVNNMNVGLPYNKSMKVSLGRLYSTFSNLSGSSEACLIDHQDKYFYEWLCGFVLFFFLLLKLTINTAKEKKISWGFISCLW